MRPVQSLDHYNRYGVGSSGAGRASSCIAPRAVIDRREGKGSPN
jgi:hypothetical protein